MRDNIENRVTGDPATHGHESRDALNIATCEQFSRPRNKIFLNII